LLAKLENLEDCIFEEETLTTGTEQVLKVAVLGSPQAGQVELLQTYLSGHVGDGDGESGNGGSSNGSSKTALERLTGGGGKSTMASIGKTHKTSVPHKGSDHAVIFRTAVGDPGPHVLAWADACLVAFNVRTSVRINRVIGMGTG
jgi:hypothetical protein